MSNKDLYKMTLKIAVPIMIQNAITNFVGLIDNIMVGQLGTEQMTGVAVVNQLLFVFNLTVFGAVSGAGIFTAQYYGKGDNEGVRDTLRFKLVGCLLISVIGIAVLYGLQEPLINLYLKGESADIDPVLTLDYGKRYLFIILISIIPFAVEQAYSGTLRECTCAMPPMVAGVVAVVVNTVLNYILIFGKFGFPALGVEGAAIATVVARYIQCLIVVIWAHTHSNREKYMQKVYYHFAIPFSMVKQITKKGIPLLLNEMLWAAGTTTLLQCYSKRGLDIVSAMNISSTISNLFNVTFIAFASGIAVVVGQMLGAGKFEEAKKSAPKLINFSIFVCVVVGAIMYFIAPVFPSVYNTTSTVKEFAASFIKISALCMPLYACMNSTYFVLRSGGKTIITFLFDSCYVWLISIPFAYVLVTYTGIGIVYIFLFCQLIEVIKCFIGLILVKRGVWITKMV